ncbi:MAG: helix-turn-helix domain-containing protein [Candidatus Dormibacteraeota bacterium]|nr:helix-turn-helix domain-containing protein [Candidatus Dormibacteraeota bacterium]
MRRQAMAPKPGPLLPPSLMTLIESRRAGLARHMARAVVSEIRWDASAGPPPSAEAIARACGSGLDLFLATAREARAPTAEELRRVAQLGVHQARGSQSVEPVLTAYRIAAKVAWNAILTAWREEKTGDPEAMVVTANYVFTALDQVAAEVTRTYLTAREQHLNRGTRARTRFFHSLITDTFDSEITLQKQALALNIQLAPGYRVIVAKLIQGKVEIERGAEMLLQAMSAVDLPTRGLSHVADPTTLVVLWPDGGAPATLLAGQLQAETELRWAGRVRSVVRAGLGSFHPGLHGVSRSYLEAQQAIDLGRRLRPEGGAHEYEEIVPYLVMTQNPLLAERYVRHHLGPLLDADARGGGLLLPTLEAFLASSSMKRAAEMLHLHRHTVIYRLDKVKEILNLDLEDAFVRHRLQLAIDIRKLL